MNDCQVRNLKQYCYSQSATVKANRLYLVLPEETLLPFPPNKMSSSTIFIALSLLAKEGSEKSQLWMNREGEMVKIYN